MDDMISRQLAIDKFIDGLDEIFADLRERHVDDSVCGLCEYDGAYLGQSGDWCNECPGFEKDNCFKLSGKIRKKWTDEIIKALPPAQPEKHTDERTETHACDLISRQDAIKTSLEFFVEFLGGAFYENSQKELIARFQRLPLAQTENDWIPVTKKAHPDEEGKYLVTDDAGGMADSTWDEFIFRDDGTPSWMYSQNVTAWKPFPEPWEEEE